MKTLQTFFLLSLTVFLITGCARSTDFGKLVRNDEVKKIFESASILPDHTYYYTGPEAEPDAIMALHNSYTLANKKNFWIKVDITEEMLQSWNRMIDNYYRVKFPYHGSRIITHDGREAGAWYSKYDYTTVKSPAPQSIIVYTPDAPAKHRFRTKPFGDRPE